MLDVYSVEQGNLRLRILVAMIFIFLFLGAILVLEQIMQFSGEDLDSYDMLNDFLDTKNSEQSLHLANFPPSGLTVSLDGSGVSLSRTQRSGRKIDDPRLAGTIPLPVSVANSDFEAVFIDGRRSLRPGSFDASKVVPLAVTLPGGVGSATKKVPVWASVTAWDETPGARTLSFNTLSFLDITVFRFGTGWRVGEIRANYSTVAWTGKETERERGIAATAAALADVLVEVHDAGEVNGK